QVLDELLADGGCPASDGSPGDVLLYDFAHLFPVESVMHIETAVLSRDDRVLQIGRDAIQCNVRVADLVGLLGPRRLKLALDLHHCGGRVKAAQREDETGTDDVKKDSQSEQTEKDFFNPVQLAFGLPLHQQRTLIIW